MSELVSIITPLYNSNDFVANTIRSVLAQTYQNWELIIIDDASTDRSVKIVESFATEDERIKLIKLGSKKGPATARNRGIKKAVGRYIAFLDSDDLWHEEKLYKQLKFMKQNHYAFTYTGFEKINEEGKVIGTVLPYKGEVCYYDLLKSNHIGCLTAMVDLKMLGCKMYMPDIKKRQDQGLWLEILKEIDKAYCLYEILGQYRIRDGSISVNKINNLKYQWKLYRNIEKINIVRSFYYMTWYAFYGMRKYSNSF
jgi:glycosyltransferase involved in cell wall biosynthesis